jgi:hypothetical protein
VTAARVTAEASVAAVPAVPVTSGPAAMAVMSRMVVPGRS